MPKLAAAAEFARRLTDVATQKALDDTITEISHWLGARYFAVSQHVDFVSAPQALRLHNYPSGWQDLYDASAYGLTDPIHRACHRTACGFHWRDVGKLVPINRGDERLLSLGQEIGLGEGVTIPVNVPGEARGSVSFVAPAGLALPDDALACAHVVGSQAFECARRLYRRIDPRGRPPISGRMRQCIALAARGLTDHQIAKRLGISVQTVIQHLREARGRLGLRTRAQLIANVLDGGEICFADCHDFYP